MTRLKTALETLNGTVDNLESALAARLTKMETTLRSTQSDLDNAGNKAKVAARVSDRLDQVIVQLETILGEGK